MVNFGVQLYLSCHGLGGDGLEVLSSGRLVGSSLDQSHGHVQSHDQASHTSYEFSKSIPHVEPELHVRQNCYGVTGALETVTSTFSLQLLSACGSSHGVAVTSGRSVFGSGWLKPDRTSAMCGMCPCHWKR